MRLALDIGGTFIKIACITDAGDILDTSKFPTDPNLSNREFVNVLVENTRKSIAEWEGEFTVIGAGMAGFVDGVRGIIHKSPNIPNIKDLELARELTKELGIPAWVENDATAAAWGEFLFGDHDGNRYMLMLTLGTGNGGGLVLDGRLYRGSRGMAGEIGQMIYEPGGPECPGGARGCFEHWTGKTGLMNDYKDVAEINELIEPEVINELAASGEKAAIEAWRNYGTRLGIMIATTANLLDLDIVVLTGGLLGAWDNFIGPLKESMNEHLITPHKDVLRVEKSTLGGNAGLLGAAFLDKTV